MVYITDMGNVIILITNKTYDSVSYIYTFKIWSITIIVLVNYNTVFGYIVLCLFKKSASYVNIKQKAKFRNWNKFHFQSILDVNSKLGQTSVYCRII